MDREQFIGLVKSEQERLRRFLFALCVGNRAEADDIAQETLLKAYLSSAGYRDEGRFTAWLYRIAHNTFIDHRRTAHATETIDSDRVAALEAMDSDADSRFQYQELYAALAMLPPAERTPILLFYMKGYSVKEISAIVDCSAEAVKMRLSRGREHLKQRMKR